MKKTSKILLVLLLVALCVSLMACNKETGPEEEKVTVNWVFGNLKIKTESIIKGSTVTSWEPSVGNYAFRDWYKDSDLTEKFDFNTKINEDITIYAELKGPKQDDPNKWYMLGAGQGTFKGSSNDVFNPPEKFKMVDVENKNTNVHTITDIVLFQGDTFAFHVPNTWDNAHGIGYFENFDQIHKNVKDGDVEYFKSVNNNPANQKLCSIETVKSGVYTFTLETNPGEERYDRITFVRKSDVPTNKKTYRMHVNCKANNFGKDFDYAQDVDYLMEEIESGMHYYIFKITADDYDDGKEYATFSLFNSNENEIIKCDSFQLKEGTYHIRFSEENNLVEVTNYGYFLIGTFIEGTNKVYDKIKVNVTPQLSFNMDKYSIEFTSIDVSKIYGSELDSTKGIMKVHVAEGSEFMIFENLYDNTGDSTYLQAGTYDISYSEFDGVVITPVV